MRRTASSPAVMSTPASAYVSGRRADAGAGTTAGSDPGSGAASDKVGSGHVVALEHALVQRRRHGDGVVAGHAGGAEPGARRARRPFEVLDRDVGQAVRAQVVLDLAHR